MAILLKNGAEFLHIPKTGGSWVTRLLAEHDLMECHAGGHKHADYDRVLCGYSLVGGRAHVMEAIRLTAKGIFGVKQNTNKKYSGFRFCFVRHPLSWYESWWKYMMDRQWHDWGVENDANYWHPNSTLNGVGSNDFNEFVRNVVRKRPGYVSELFFSYTKPGISYIGKMETLADDLVRVLDHMKVSIHSESMRNSRPLNVSPPTPSPIEWDPQLRKTVMLLELPALLHFGYLTAKERDKYEIPEYILENTSMKLPQAAPVFES